MREEEKLSREIRSVAPTISNAIIQTTRATSSAAAHVKSGSSSGSETSATASQAASDMTNGDLAGSVKPTEHEIVYYKTCLACREQQDLCKVLKNLIFFGCFFVLHSVFKKRWAAYGTDIIKSFVQIGSNFESNRFTIEW